MSLIKFPSHIQPDRVTVQLIRVDETFISPVTNIQQVVSRGNAAWRWTYEYTDISEDEREVVQAFLIKAKGRLNHFMVTDPADYLIRGNNSDWIDVYSGYGSFNVTAGSGDNTVNSWFFAASQFDHHITDDRTVRFSWVNRNSAQNLAWRGHGTDRLVNSFEIGKAYVQRIKNFNSQSPRLFSFSVGSASSPYFVQSAPVFQVESTAMVTAPFIAATTSHQVSVVDWVEATNILGDYFELADYRLMRCVLVSNSENLLTRSNEFDHADWTIFNAIVESGWADASPTGVTSGGWKIYGNADVNTTHLISQVVTKITTEDIYTTSIYAKASELGSIRIQLDRDSGADRTDVLFHINSGTVGPIIDTGVSIRGTANIYDVGSGWFRCQVTGIVSSHSLVRELIYIGSGTSTQFTNDGSAGIEIFGAQLRKHPFMGHYVPTVANTVVPQSGQVGSQLYVDGFDPDENVLKSGQRFEIVNRFHNDTNDVYERSEFKRLTREVRSHREGWAVLEFDPPIRNAPATDRSWRQQDHLGETMHNPVIFHLPEMKARLIAGTIQYVDKPLKYTDIVFDVIEDMT